MCERQRNIGEGGRGKEVKIPLPEAGGELVRDKFPVRIAAGRDGMVADIEAVLRGTGRRGGRNADKKVVGLDV